MQTLELLSVSDPENPIEDKCCPCLTIPRGVGIISFISLLLGLMVISFAITDLIKASQGQLEVVKREKVSEKAQQPPKQRSTELMDKINKKVSVVWFGAYGTGLMSGIIQAVASFWFVYCALKEEKLGFKANIWILCHFIVILMFLTIFGAVFIAGYHPNDTIKIFGIDFFFVNILTLVCIIIVRGEVGQLKNENPRQGISALTALLVL